MILSISLFSSSSFLLSSLYSSACLASISSLSSLEVSTNLSASELKTLNEICSFWSIYDFRLLSFPLSSVRSEIGGILES